MGITGKLNGLVSAFTETEREFVSVERCKQYLDNIEVEDFDGGVTTTPYNWPSEGIIVFKDVSFRYVSFNFTQKKKEKEKSKLCSSVLTNEASTHCRNYRILLSVKVFSQIFGQINVLLKNFTVN